MKTLLGNILYRAGMGHAEAHGGFDRDHPRASPRSPSARNTRFDHPAVEAASRDLRDVVVSRGVGGCGSRPGGRWVMADALVFLGGTSNCELDHQEAQRASIRSGDVRVSGVSDASAASADSAAVARRGRREGSHRRSACLETDPH